MVVDKTNSAARFCQGNSCGGDKFEDYNLAWLGPLQAQLYNIFIQIK